MSFDPASFIKNLTGRPGVYCMQDADRKTIYVGKAKNLRKRVASYFNQAKSQSPKNRAMIKHVDNIEITVTNTENEALILENNLIKRYRPRYNILFRDDKSYPYLYLSADHEYPHFRYHRGALNGKGRYFGPYPGAGAVRRSLHLIQKLFLIRSCEDSVFANRSRPCLQYQIKRCSAPCVGYVSRAAYRRDVEHATLFLEGKNEKVIQALTEPMNKAADALDYESAARFRDQIRSIRTIQERQYITAGGGDLDIVGCAKADNQACIQLVFVRAGLNLGSRSYFPKHSHDRTESDLVGAFINQYYLNHGKQQKIPAEILISHEISDKKWIESVLHENTGMQVRLKNQVRGERLKWLKMAVDNAKIGLKQRLASNQNQAKRYRALQELLSLSEPVQRMECFDISHTQGEATVASCVVFGPDGPVNSSYRHFNIEGIKKGDDYAAMRQVIRRRYTRLVKEEARLPDLIVIDGGPGQVNSAKAELDELQLTHIPLLGVAKGPARKAGSEKLILALENKIIDCDSASPALHLIQHIRDEAHRFAITSHRQRRKKTRSRSKLERIDGVGNKRRQSLIKHFGGLQGVEKAGIDDLIKTPGISKSLALKIYETLHGFE